MKAKYSIIIGLSALLLLGAVNWTGPVQVGPACTTNIPISQTTSTDLKTLTNNGYICFVKVISATAQNVSLVSGTGTTCATSPTALDGATTAANGNPLAANTGWVAPIPSGSYLKTPTTAQHLCLLQDGTGRLAGFILYTDAP